MENQNKRFQLPQSAVFWIIFALVILMLAAFAIYQYYPRPYKENKEITSLKKKIRTECRKIRDLGKEPLSEPDKNKCNSFEIELCDNLLYELDEISLEDTVQLKIIQQLLIEAKNFVSSTKIPDKKNEDTRVVSNPGGKRPQNNSPLNCPADKNFRYVYLPNSKNIKKCGDVYCVNLIEDKKNYQVTVNLETDGCIPKDGNYYLFYQVGPKKENIISSSNPIFIQVADSDTPIQMTGFTHFIYTYNKYKGIPNVIINIDVSSTEILLGDKHFLSLYIGNGSQTKVSNYYNAVCVSKDKGITLEY